MKGVSFMKKKNVCGLLLVGIVFSCLIFGRTVLANTGLYRLYHPGLKVHLYTQDTNEYKVLGSRGWQQEGPAFRSHGKLPVLRLYQGP